MTLKILARAVPLSLVRKFTAELDRHYPSFLAVSLVTIILTACTTGQPGKPSPSTPGPTGEVEATVGSAGGNVGTESGGSLDIPSGALADDVDFTSVEDPTPPKGAWFTPVSAVVDIGPNGTVFSSPARLSFPFDSSKIPDGKSESDLVIFASNDHGKTWEALETSVSNGIATGEVNHLTKFVVGTPACKDAKCPYEVQAALAGKQFITRTSSDSELADNGCIRFDVVHAMLKAENSAYMSKPIDAVEKVNGLKYGYRLVTVLPGCSKYAEQIPKWVLLNEPMRPEELISAPGTNRTILYVDQKNPCCVATDPKTFYYGKVNKWDIRKQIENPKTPACDIRTALISAWGNAIVKVAGGVYYEHPKHSAGPLILSNQIILTNWNDENVTISGLKPLMDRAPTGAQWKLAKTDTTGSIYVLPWSDKEALPVVANGEDITGVVHFDEATRALDSRSYVFLDHEVKKAPIYQWGGTEHKKGYDAHLDPKSRTSRCTTDGKTTFECLDPTKNCCLVTEKKATDGSPICTKHDPTSTTTCLHRDEKAHECWLPYHFPERQKASQFPASQQTDCNTCNKIANFGGNNVVPTPGQCQAVSHNLVANRALDFCRQTLGSEITRCLLLKVPQSKKIEDYILQVKGTYAGLAVHNNLAHKTITSGSMIRGIRLSHFPISTYTYGVGSFSIPSPAGYKLRLSGVHAVNSGIALNGYGYDRMENSFLDRSVVNVAGNGKALPQNVRVRNNYFYRTWGKPVTFYFSYDEQSVLAEPNTRTPKSLHKLPPLCEGSDCDTQSGITLYGGKEDFISDKWKGWNIVTLNTFDECSGVQSAAAKGLVVAYNHFTQGGMQEGIFEAERPGKSYLIYHNWALNGLGVGIIFGSGQRDTLIADNQVFNTGGSESSGAGPRGHETVCATTAMSNQCSLVAGTAGIQFAPDGGYHNDESVKPYICEDVTIENNLVVKTRGVGVQACKNAVVRNNTITHTPTDYRKYGGFTFMPGPAGGDYTPMRVVDNITIDPTQPTYRTLTIQGLNNFRKWFAFDVANSTGNYFMGCSGTEPTKCQGGSYLVGGAAGTIFTDLKLESAALKYALPEKEHYGLSGFPAEVANMCTTGRFRHPGFNYLYEACNSGSAKQPSDFKNVHDYSGVHLAMDTPLSVGQSCELDAACSAGLSCVEGVCRIRALEGTACAKTSDCGSGMSCAEGLCQYAYGNACVGDNVCGEFLKCDSGFCQAPCEFEAELMQSCKEETASVDCTYRLFHCKDMGSCGRLNGLVNGEQCKEGLACESGFCVDGVCCDQICGENKADCLACSIAAGAEKDGECSAAASGTVCRSTLLDDEEKNPCDIDEVCDGKEKACPEDLFVADNTVCESTGICQFGSCVLQGQNGSGCEESKDCLSGNCVEQVCCDTACSGECSSCSNAAGKCTILKDGAVCGDGDLCTIGDTCQKGKCTSGEAKKCEPTDECFQSAECVYATGECVDNVSADDGTFCTGGICTAGECQAGCSILLTSCFGKCTDLSTDAENCGKCGRVCGLDDVCEQGDCSLPTGSGTPTCSTGLADCNGICVDLTTADEDCGSCGYACAPDRNCQGGVCVKPTPVPDTGIPSPPDASIPSPPDAHIPDAPDSGGSGTLLLLGDPCNTSGQCDSTICSDDGYCCATTCAGECNSCYGGSCAVVSAGYPCTDAPGGVAGLCDGNGACAATTVNKALGETCAVFGECASGYCSDDKVCCNQDCRDGCGTCDNSGAAKGTCNPVANGTVCGATDCIAAGQCQNAQCQGLSPTNEWLSCDGGNGVCVGGTCDAVAGSPIGAACTSAGTCATQICADDGQCCDVACTGECNTCLSGTCEAKPITETCSTGFCDGNGACDNSVPLLADGAVCTAGSECSSTICTDDGYCCATTCVGECNSCSGGTCAVVSAGYPCNDAPGGVAGLCDGNGACEAAAVGKALGEVCTVFGECASTFCSDDGVCCNQDCRDGCGTCDNLGSAKGTCIPDANGTACGATECVGGGQCQNAQCQGLSPTNEWLSCDGGNGVCTGGTCDPNAGSPIGAACSSPGTCATNICADSGQCCDVSCAGECNTCATGTCEAKPITDACSTGFCDGNGACDTSAQTNKGPGDVCGAPGECTSGFCSEDGFCCNEACGFGGCGTCVGGTCTPKALDTACGTATECLTAGKCDGAGQCPGNSKTQINDWGFCGTAGVCSGGTCQEGWGDPITAVCTGDAIGSNDCATGICSGFNGPGSRYCCLTAYCDDTECCDCSSGDTVNINEGGACTANGGSTCQSGQCL